MDRKINDVTQSVGGYEEFERLVKQGRKMHDQAVFDLFARLMSKAGQSVKGILSITIKKQESKDCHQEIYQSVF
jgi:hypothetical protein